MDGINETKMRRIKDEWHRRKAMIDCFGLSLKEAERLRWSR